MSDPAATEKRIARLERRLDRERSARQAAETIADRRMRELWLNNQELDKRVAERTNELELALEQVEATTAAAAGFFSSLSHEMMTPLNGIFGLLEMLRDNSHSDANRSWANAGLDSADRLHHMLQRLLDLGEIRSGRISNEPAPVRCATVADVLRNDWQTVCLKKQKLLTISTGGLDDMTLFVDQQLLLKVIGEFVANAATYAAPGVISIEFVAESPSAVSISVRDGGEGFDVQPHDDLLQTVANADHSPSRSGGLGIGLAFARHVAELMGGSTRVQSAPGSPTTASVVVPTNESDDISQFWDRGVKSGESPPMKRYAENA